MNENTSFERYVAEAFEREGPGRPVPGAIHDDLISHAGKSRQWPGWLASIKEPPMRLSDSLTVGSPTVRVVAIMAATLLLALLVAGAGIAGSRLLAADAAIIVDPSGGGNYTTIEAAVAAAEDGDTILVRPGTYPEAVTITRSITLRGEDPERVVIEVGNGCSTDPETDEQTCPAGVPMYDGFWYEPTTYGLLLDGTDAQVSDLSFGFPGDGSGIVVNGGAPMITGIAYDTDEAFNNVYIHGGSAATVRDSDFGDVYVIAQDRSPVTVEDSRFGVIEVNTGDDPSEVGGPATIRNNRAAAIMFDGSALIEGNEVFYPADDDEFDVVIEVQGGEGWVIRDNVVRGSANRLGAISLIEPGIGAGEITGNTLIDNEVSISLAVSALIEGNTITDGGVGIVVSGGSPELIDNTVERMSDLGITIGLADPILTGNRSCGNGTDLRILGRADPVIDDTNDICVVDDLRSE